MEENSKDAPAEETKGFEISDVIEKLQNNGEFADIMVIRVKADNSSFDITTAGPVDVASGQFTSIERFRQIGILESAKTFVQNFAQNEMTSRELDELDIKLAPTLAEQGFKVGDNVNFPKEVYEMHMRLRKQVEDRGLDIADAVAEVIDKTSDQTSDAASPSGEGSEQ